MTHDLTTFSDCDTDLDLLARCKLDIARLRLEFALLLLDGVADERDEVGAEVSSEERLVRWDGEDGREDLGTVARLQHHQAAVHAAPTQVRRILRQVDVAQPLHDAVVRPQNYLIWTVLQHTLDLKRKENLQDIMLDLRNFVESNI